MTLGSDAEPGSVEDTEEQYCSFGCEANLLRGASRSELKGQKVQKVKIFIKNKQVKTALKGWLKF